MQRFLTVTVFALLVSACGHATPEHVESTATATLNPPRPTEGATLLPAAIEIHNFPVIPAISEYAREIFLDGQARGRNAQVFAKVGDCMTDSPNYLIPFSTGQYDLDNQDHLQATIDWFKAVTVRDVDGQPVDSFSTPSMAAGSGFTSAGPLDPTWANPNWCQSGESPLVCEYRITNPSLALIMFGTSDVYSIQPDKFEHYLRTMIEETIDGGIVPILSTFPPRPDYPEDSIIYNEIVVQLAVDYDIPLVNLWLALQDVPGYGVDPEHPNRLTLPEDGCAACFTPDHMDAGITVHNMTTLMVLHEVTKEMLSR
ncbi:MAG: SGNH/GDSL hydrolase family protein [Anaerolineae bacterium]|nr:SGNH/GDSL hydrolase family protein [Anaerolineae bacterium]